MHRYRRITIVGLKAHKFLEKSSDLGPKAHELREKNSGFGLKAPQGAQCGTRGVRKARFWDSRCTDFLSKEEEGDVGRNMHKFP